MAEDRAGSGNNFIYSPESNIIQVDLKATGKPCRPRPRLRTLEIHEIKLTPDCAAELGCGIFSSLGLGDINFVFPTANPRLGRQKKWRNNMDALNAGNNKEAVTAWTDMII